MNVRKIVTIVEETRKEMNQRLSVPTRKAAAVAIIENPFAGRYQEDLGELVDAGEELGGLLANAAREALRITSNECEGYGKGAVIGTHGELEHGHAILHEKFGGPVRKVCGGGKAIIPSSAKVGGPGTQIDIPTAYKHAFAVRTHYDSMAVSVPRRPPGRMKSWWSWWSPPREGPWHGELGSGRKTPRGWMVSGRLLKARPRPVYSPPFQKV